MVKATKQYKENYHGILCHDGWVKVAKSPIIAKIINIQGQIIRVKSYNMTKSKFMQYNCYLHKNLKKDLRYLAINDTVSIKWNKGNPYIVGYRKADAEEDIGVNSNTDQPISENMNWIDFFGRIDTK